MLQLEEHWQTENRPSVIFTSNEKMNESNFNIVLDKFPLPENFLKNNDTKNIAIDVSKAKIL